MTDPTAFRSYVESLPAGTAVPVPREQLLEWLHTTAGIPEAGPDPTVAQVAQRFGRAPSTVRGWILGKKLTAYRFEGHELRVTRASLEAFESSQRVTEKRVTQRRSGKAVDLAAYRHAS